MTNPGTPAPTGGGMPKWLIILLVVMLVMIVGCCGAFSACWFFAGRAAKSVGEAAQNAMINEAKKQGVESDMTGAGVTLPAEFPADVSVYSGFKATTKVAPPGQNGGMVIFQGKETPAKVASYYESELGKKGWTQVTANTNGDTILQQYTKDNLTVTITATGNASDCMLQIAYEKK